MADGSGIEWTEATWNPVVGCAHVSPGCDACYAAREAAGRLAHLPAYAGLAVREPGEHARFTGEVRLLPDRLDQPLRWQRPRRIFVNSMSDLFHPGVPASFVDRVWATMEAAPRHLFQILTKRPVQMRAYLAGRPALPNVWVGTSIENDRYSFRGRDLAETPGAVRWVSAEPLLGPLPSLRLAGLDWLVVGAESGPRARPMDIGWAIDLVDRCREAGVAVFVKQLTGPGGRPLKALDDFPEPLRVREYPTAVGAPA